MNRRPLAGDTGPLARGREAFARDDWPAASSELAAADRLALLDPEDLERLATATYLAGDESASIDARSRAHHGFLARGDVLRAARNAFWIAFGTMDRPGR